MTRRRGADVGFGTRRVGLEPVAHPGPYGLSSATLVGLHAIADKVQAPPQLDLPTGGEQVWIRACGRPFTVDDSTGRIGRDHPEPSAR